MLDWAISKMLMSMAAVTLIVLSLYFFTELVKKNQVADNKMQDIADQIAERVSDVSNFQGVIKYNITFQESAGEGGMILPIHLDDDDYDIIFTRQSVSVSHLSESRTAYFSSRVHIFDPVVLPRGELTSDAIEGLDDVNRIGEIESGTDFVVENRERIVDGQHTYLTFLYPVMSI